MKLCLINNRYHDVLSFKFSTFLKVCTKLCWCKLSEFLREQDMAHYKVSMRNLMTYDRYPIFPQAPRASAAEHSQNTNQAWKMKEKEVRQSGCSIDKNFIVKYVLFSMKNVFSF